MVEKKENDTMLWQVGKDVYVCRLLPNTCQVCKATGVLVGLPPPLQKKQEDGTNVVCHPALGGCNHGFSMELPNGLRLAWGYK